MTTLRNSCFALALNFALGSKGNTRASLVSLRWLLIGKEASLDWDIDTSERGQPTKLSCASR